LAAFTTIGITVILTRTLTLSDYATHKQALTIFAMIAPVLTLGLPKALYFFLPGETERPRGILLENLTLLLCASSVFAGIILFGGGDFFADHFGNPQLKAMMPMVAVYGFCMLPIAATSPTLMARDRVGHLVGFQLTTQAVLITAVACATYWYATPMATLSAYAIWSFAALIVAVVFMFHSTQGGHHSGPTRTGMKTQLAYGVPLGLAAMFGGLSTQIDKYMVSVMCSTEDFAIYAAGAVELPLIGVITGAMNAVVLPELAKSYKARKLHAIRDLWQRAMNKAILILAPAMFVVLLFGTELVVALFSESYEDAAIPFRIYALSLPLRSAVYGSVLMATNRTKWVTISAIVGLSLNVLLNYFFVSWLGYAGAAWASVLSIYGVVLFMLIPMCKALETTPAALFDWPHLTKVMFATAVPAALVYMGFSQMDVSGLVKLLTGTAVYGALVLISYRVLKITTVGELIAFIRKRK
jgi:O-antigen/teichoic acid export membrane protein